LFLIIQEIQVSNEFGVQVSLVDMTAEGTHQHIQEHLKSSDIRQHIEYCGTKPINRGYFVQWDITYTHDLVEFHFFVRLAGIIRDIDSYVLIIDHITFILMWILYFVLNEVLLGWTDHRSYPARIVTDFALPHVDLPLD
jgi:hypothetical protein